MMIAACFALPREEYYVFTGNCGNGKGVLADLMCAKMRSIRPSHFSRRKQTKGRD
jgi:hypothetical protein